jgi:hypothetical protein
VFKIDQGPGTLVRPAPLSLASEVKLYCVLAMHIGSLPRPIAVYFAIWASASGV